MNELSINRTPKTVGQEVRALTAQAKAMTLYYGVEIGRRLKEAKEILPHGEWGAWLSSETEFSQSSANRFVRLFNEYGSQIAGISDSVANSSTLTNLSISNALRLLAVPEEEREAFAQEVDAAHISARDLDAAIKERDAAKKALSDAESKLKGLDELEKAKKASDDRAKAAETKASEAIKSVRRLEQELEAIKKRPIDVAVETVVDKVSIENAAKVATAEAEKKLQAQLDEAKAAVKAAEAETQAAKAEQERLRKLAAGSDGDTSVYKAYMEQAQETFNRATGILLRIQARDAEKAEKLRQYAYAVLKMMLEAAKGAE